jgi:Cellulase (glycosyl hydrolase family 5)
MAMASRLGTTIDRTRHELAGRIGGRAMLTGLLATVVCAAAGASRAQATEAGVNASNPSAAQVADMKALGTHWVRMFVSWRAMQPTPGAIAPSALASYEQMFSQLPPGTKVILDVVGTPEWETGSANEHAPPANPNDYAAFVGALAQRFGSQVSAYEIWNEEDAPGWWVGGPNPAAYAQLLKAAYPAIKAADPSATVVLGGLTGNDYQFLEGVYQAGGKGSFDAVGVHTDTACNKLSPYEFLRGPEDRLIPDSFLAYREVHAVMLANGDDKPIWMTELSWRTTNATCSEGAWAGQTAEGVSEEQQATYLRQAYHCLAQDPYVQVALWFTLQDEGSVTSGLVRANGSRKPSFAAMQSYEREGDTLSEPCGAFSGPKITVAAPANHVTYRGPLPIQVSATSSEGVFRIRLEIDGKLIRNYDGSGFPTTLFGALDWQGAKHIPYGWHTLTFLAYDKENNVSETSISVYHAGPKPKHRRKHRRRR